MFDLRATCERAHWLALPLGVVMMAALMGAAMTAADAQTGETGRDRLAGADRFDTAAELAQATADDPDGVVLASGESFPDALVASYGPAGVDAPVLLTARDRIPAATEEALAALDPDTVTVVGGEAAVSDDVADALSGDYEVHRAGGADRYRTAAAMLAGPQAPEVGTVDGRRTALLASGEGFADTLAAGPLAAGADLPLLLTTAELGPATEIAADAMEGTRHDVDIEQVIIVGGPAAVGEDVADYLRDERGFDVERWHGDTRTETAAVVAAEALNRFDFDAETTLLARGDDFADALAAAPLAGADHAPLLLARNSRALGFQAGEWLVQRCETVATVMAVGGPAAVSGAVVGMAADSVDRCELATDPLADLSVADLERGAAGQSQEIAFTFSRDPGEPAEPVNVDLTQPLEDDLVAYDGDAGVRVVRGDGQARLELEPAGVVQQPGVVYHPGEGDAAGDTVRLEVVGGADAADVDASTLASVPPTGPVTTFDLGAGGPLAPAVHGVVSQDDSFTQHLELHPVDELASGEQVTLDLSDAEQGPVSYADAEATVERGSGAATLDVAAGSSAELTYTVGAGGDAPGEGAVRIRLHPVTTEQVGENERYDAVVTRQATGEAQTTRFWVGQPPFD